MFILTSRITDTKSKKAALLQTALLVIPYSYSARKTFPRYHLNFFKFINPHHRGSNGKVRG